MSVPATRPAAGIAARLALACLVLLALGLRTWRLGDASVWFDEALEIERAAQPLERVVVARGIDQDPPLYSVGLHAWLRLGDSDGWCRLPGALAGALAVALVGAWGWRLGGRAVGLSAAALLAVSPAAVHYSMEVNQYALVMPLAVALAWSAERVIAAPRSGSWPCHTAICIASLGTHYGLVFPILAQLPFVWVASRRATAGRIRFAGHLVALLAAVLLLWRLGLGRNLAVAHVQGRFGGTDLAGEVAWLQDVFWRDVIVFLAVPWSGGAALVLARGFAVLAALGAVLALYRGGPARRALAAWMPAVLLATYMASGLGWYPFGGRYALMVLPAAIVSVAACAAAPARLLPGRTVGHLLAGLATGAACLAPLPFLPQLDPVNPDVAVPREELRPVLERVAADARMGQRLYVYHGARPAFAKYSADGTFRQRPDVLAGRVFDLSTVAAEAARLEAWAADSGAVWLVFSHVTPGDHEALLQAMLLRDEPLWALSHCVEAPGAVACLLTRPAPSSEGAGLPGGGGTGLAMAGAIPIGTQCRTFCMDGLMNRRYNRPTVLDADKEEVR